MKKKQTKAESKNTQKIAKTSFLKNLFNRLKTKITIGISTQKYKPIYLDKEYIMSVLKNLISSDNEKFKISASFLFDQTTFVLNNGNLVGAQAWIASNGQSIVTFYLESILLSFLKDMPNIKNKPLTQQLHEKIVKQLSILVADQLFSLSNPKNKYTN